jgi:hypothetical protein
VSRIRQIKPAFFKHAELYDAEVSSGLPLRVAFAGLWTVADKRGVFQWSRNVKPDVLPYDACDMLAVLDALAAAGFILRYEVDGKAYGFIHNFAAHQHFHHHEKDNGFPPPSPETETPPTPVSVQTEASPGPDRRVSGIGYLVSGIGDQEEQPTRPPRKAAKTEKFAEEFAEFWDAYPKRSGGNPRPKAYRAYCARRAEEFKHSLIMAGVKRYDAFLHATGKAGTEFVMQAVTFVGPDRRWEEDWTTPAIVVTGPPRPRPYTASPSEEADRRHKADVALADRYASEAHRAGCRWADVSASRP